MTNPNPAYDFIKATADTVQRIEREYATYLFKKKVVPVIREQQQSPEQLGETETKYMNTLFIKKKSMSADSYLQMELDEIAMANADYAENPDKYQSKRTMHGYPDEYRCNYISQEKTHFKRCSQKSMDGEFYCSQHINTPNKHLREYEKAVDALQ